MSNSPDDGFSSLLGLLTLGRDMAEGIDLVDLMFGSGQDIVVGLSD